MTPTIRKWNSVCLHSQPTLIVVASFVTSLAVAYVGMLNWVPMGSGRRATFAVMLYRVFAIAIGGLSFGLVLRFVFGFRRKPTIGRRKGIHIPYGILEFVCVAISLIIATSFWPFAANFILFFGLILLPSFCFCLLLGNWFLQLRSRWKHPHKL